MERDSQQALRDIEYIKQFMTRNRRKLVSAPPYLFIWGCYMMIGFLGMQFDLERWPIWFWSCGSVVGSVLTAIVGKRQSRQSAISDGGAYGWMFWLPFAAVLVSGGFMMMMEIVQMQYASILWLMLIGIAYVSMGALLGKGPVILGIWFIVLAMVTRMLFLEYQFLIFGLLGGGSFVATAILLQRQGIKHGK